MNREKGKGMLLITGRDQVPMYTASPVLPFQIMEVDLIDSKTIFYTWQMAVSLLLYALFNSCIIIEINKFNNTCNEILELTNCHPYPTISSAPVPTRVSTIHS